MKKIYHNKLVRDKIPEIIKSRGGNFETKTVSKEEISLLLKRKLIEESKEVYKSSHKSLMFELADVLQIVRSIVKTEGYQFKDLHSKLKEKAKSNGEYDKGIFLVWTDKPKGYGDKVTKQ